MVSSDSVGKVVSGKAGARSDTHMDDIVDGARWVTQLIEDKEMNASFSCSLMSAWVLWTTAIAS